MRTQRSQLVGICTVLAYVLERKLKRSPAGAAPIADDKDLFEVTQENYWDTIKGAGDSLVVVDCYTDWCGPCKMIKPILIQWSEEMKGVKFVKFNCNKQNKDLGKALGIKVAPTFFLYKNGDQVATMTGAKVDQLRALVDEHM